MTDPECPIALVATDAPKRIKPSNDPQPFAAQMEGRTRVSPSMCVGFNSSTLDQGTIK